MDLQTLKETVGANIRYYRLLKDISQIQLAHLADLSETLISELETGKCNTCIETLWRIANALGIEVFELYKPREVR